MTSFKQKYERRKAILLEDTSICMENRKLFEEFFEFEEYKLKRQNHLPALASRHSTKARNRKKLDGRSSVESEIRAEKRPPTGTLG